MSHPASRSPEDCANPRASAPSARSAESVDAHHSIQRTPARAPAAMVHQGGRPFACRAPYAWVEELDGGVAIRWRRAHALAVLAAVGAGARPEAVEGALDSRRGRAPARMRAQPPARAWLDGRRAGDWDPQCRYRFDQLRAAGAVPDDLERIPQSPRPRLSGVRNAMQPRFAVPPRIGFACASPMRALIPPPPN
jgi:hypothetical protein